MFTTRHGDLIKDIHMATPIMIVGVGSIGSYVALTLSKLGFTNLLVIDDGIVEEENIAPQLYRLTDIGRPKVDAIKAQIKMMTGTVIRTHHGRFEADNSTGKIDEALRQVMLNTFNEGKTEGNAKPFITIMACDSMKARENVFNYISNYFSDDIDFYIDARMAIEFLTVYSFQHSKENFEAYRSTLFTDAEGVQEACTNKAISYTSAIAGSLVSKCVLDLLKGRQKQGTLRTIQFDIGSLDMMVM